MSDTRAFKDFILAFEESIIKDSFVTIRISNPVNKEDDQIKKITAKPVELKKGRYISFVMSYPTKDITKNFTLDESPTLIKDFLENQFYQSELITEDYTWYLTIFSNGRAKLRKKSMQEIPQKSLSHNKEKERMIPANNNLYLQKLGITTSQFKVKNKTQDKFKQINKYIEIIDDILKRTKLPKEATIVDMGSGKGYLTFALYDYFQRIREEKPEIYGIELREDLVQQCNKIATDINFENLHFEASYIEERHFDSIDFLIALHACDTATDDAIKKGIQSGSKLIICAPCCHKQVRKHMHTEGVLENITQHGILMERQAEILTDTIRAMVLEAYGYKTRVFEFISTQHTPKNVLIVASLIQKKETPDPKIIAEIESLKKQFGIAYHYLQRVMEKK